MVLSTQAVWDASSVYERATLGLAITKPNDNMPALLELSPDDFSHPALAQVFGACKALFMGRQSVDVVNLVGALGVEYQELIGLLGLEAPQTGNAVEYAQKIREQAAYRRLTEQAQALQLLCGERRPMEEIAGRLTAMLKEFAPSTSQSMNALQGLESVYNALGQRHAYYSTGFACIDKHLLLDKGDYLIIAGRPSSGKTAFALQMALCMAYDKNVAFFSLETSVQKIYDRLLCNYTGADFGALNRRQESERDKLLQCGADFGKLKIQVVNAAGYSVAQVAAKALSLQAQVIFIDYLSLLKGEGRSLYEQVTNISKNLHIFAQRFGVTVIALSQVNRQGEQGLEMSHLRESGQIEQDADAILLIDNVDNTPVKPNIPREKIIKLAKNKTGSIGQWPFYFYGNKQWFAPAETRY